MADIDEDLPPVPVDIVVPSGFYVGAILVDGEALYGAWAPGGYPLGVFRCPHDAAVAVWFEYLHDLQKERVHADLLAAIEQMLNYYHERVADFSPSKGYTEVEMTVNTRRGGPTRP